MDSYTNVTDDKKNSARGVARSERLGSLTLANLGGVLRMSVTWRYRPIIVNLGLSGQPPK